VDHADGRSIHRTSSFRKTAKSCYWSRGCSRMNPAFERYIGIDYSGAETPKSSLKGLRVYEADRLTVPQEIQPPPSPRKYWTRRGIAEWFVERLSQGPPTLVGIDHGFSFPLRYFEQHGLALDWPSFLDDFHRHWPTDEDVYVDFVRRQQWKWRGPPRQSPLASGDRTAGTHSQVGVPFRRVGFSSEVHARRNSMARYIRQHAKDHVHFWPFDGWSAPPNRSVVAEVYPALLEQDFSKRWTNARPARRLCYRQMVATGGL
jgi:hypothetical protein